MTRDIRRTPGGQDPTAQGNSGSQDLDEIARRVTRITEENKQLFVQLLDGERRFRSLAKGVWKVQEDERRRLALELHDGIGQTLTALKNQLQRIEARADEQLRPSIADSVELASGALNDTRELSRLLRPPVLDDLGLVAALNWLKRTLHQRTGLVVELDAAGLEAERMDPDIETLVFRVVQEALTNIIKHAGVQTASVTLLREGGMLSLTVSDKGKGFDPEAKLRPGGSNESSGLRGMRDRIELFGGTMQMRSSGEDGSTLVMRVPLPDNGGTGG